MSNQTTGKENQEQTNQKVDIEDLEVADVDATQVKGGPVFLKVAEVDGR